MIPKSIRWRLPLSYAGIALLATLVLGGVMLAILRSYYLDRELDFLGSNAQVFSASGLMCRGARPNLGARRGCPRGLSIPGRQPGA